MYNCVYVVRQLVADKFMLDVREQNYKEFLSHNYQIDLDKFKALSILATSNRKALYKLIKIVFNSIFKCSI